MLLSNQHEAPARYAHPVCYNPETTDGLNQSCEAVHCEGVLVCRVKLYGIHGSVIGNDHAQYTAGTQYSVPLLDRFDRIEIVFEVVSLDHVVHGLIRERRKSNSLAH